MQIFLIVAGAICLIIFSFAISLREVNNLVQNVNEWEQKQKQKKDADKL